MLKRLVVLIACLGVIQLSGCTSKDSKEDDSGEMAIDVGDSAEVEKVEGEQNLDIAAEDSSASLSTNEALPEDALGDAPANNGAPSAGGDLSLDGGMDNPPPPEVAGNEPPPLVEDTLPQETLPPDSLGDAGAATTESVPPVVDSSEPAPEASSESAPKKSARRDEGETKAEPKPTASYRKVDPTPRKEGGKILNTVYIARAGDTWASVSKQIYGSEKASDLKKMNPAIKGRKVKVGDKIYYNSPHRPDDESKVLTYYEDSGIAPEVYIAKSGDNLKKVAKELFGNEQAWKELYATNEFESKGNLDEGTQVRYWRSAPTSEVAAAQPPAGAPPADGQASMPPAPPPGGEMPPTEGAPPPPPDMASNEMAPPPPPPPPPVEAVAPPPPPPPPDMGKPAGAVAGHEPMEDDQMTTLAAGAVVAVGLALFMIMRRRRKKELEQAIQDTQVG